MSQPPSTSPVTPAGESSDAQAHIAGLHKMSTTAGITNRDYVAVNHLCVASVLLGLAGGLAFFGYVMLVFPLAAAVCGIVAIRQIGNSSGTQTGKPLAILGLALAVLCGGGAVALELSGISAARGEAKVIGRTVNDYGRFLREKKYKQAYELYEPEFHQRISLDQFEKGWETIQRDTDRGFGRLEIMEWNGVPPLFDSIQGSRRAFVKAKVKYVRTTEERYDFVLREVGKKWMIHQIPGLFEPERKRSKADQFNF